jgi:predicted dehydrogenase
MRKKRVIVIGYGAIGRRHAKLLAEAGHQPVVVTRQPLAEYPAYSDLTSAFAEYGHETDLIVVASVTAQHNDDLRLLERLDYKGAVLVEKPLFDRMPPVDEQAPPPFEAMVAYNLRFHPVIIALKDALSGRTLLSASLVAGQDLTQWRPGRETRQTYSAHRNQGGGVVRDLSHEFDLAQHLFGKLQLLASHSARVGNVTVDSEDIALAAFATPSCPFVSVQLDYLDTQPRREIRVITEGPTLVANLLQGTLTIDGRAQAIPSPVDASYRNMHAAALTDKAGVCNWYEGLEIVSIANRIAPHD